MEPSKPTIDPQVQKADEIIEKVGLPEVREEEPVKQTYKLPKVSEHISRIINAQSDDSSHEESDENQVV